MMMSTQEATTVGLTTHLADLLQRGSEEYRAIYDQNRHRIYALAFWMTDNELAAEELMVSTFCRAFEWNHAPADDQIDRAFIAELRKEMPLGSLTLHCEPSPEVRAVRYNVLRVDLERAVIQLPSTEKLIFLMHDVEGYDHARIAHTLSLSDDESRLGLYQARVFLRELLAKPSSFVYNS